MGYANQLRDKIEVQTLTDTEDGAGGYTGSWVTDLRISCRIVSLSSRENKTYGRDGFESFYSVLVRNPIPTTNGFSKLYDFLNGATRARARLLYEGLRTLTIVGFQSMTQGKLGTHGDMLTITVGETPRAIGVVDA